MEYEGRMNILTAEYTNYAKHIQIMPSVHILDGVREIIHESHRKKMDGVLSRIYFEKDLMTRFNGPFCKKLYL